MKKSTPILLSLSLLFISDCSYAQPLNDKIVFTHQDTLRGSITPERAWWDVLYYNIYVAPDYNSKTIKGWNQITFGIKIPGKNKIMQMDLQEPMMIDSIFLNDTKISTYKREGNVYWIDFGNKEFKKSMSTSSDEKNNSSLKIFFHGTPRKAVNAPWDGGWIWTKDEKDRPWMTVACQGLGASVWYPSKDHQSDEPDNGATLAICVPDSLVAVGNGRLKEKKSNHDGNTTWIWEVKNPINNYSLVPYIGKYVNFTDTLNGEKGRLDLSYWVLDYNLEKAREHFAKNVKPMLKCFEYWFGPYPFYEDSYKLIESSHLGMEHQSAVAYGNHYLNGYYLASSNSG
ncbi:MAG: M1 family peptidase, partial [Bacteroidia bacterium]|nr:M1 family peptidase [Bacteroidia bacterium]